MKRSTSLSSNLNKLLDYDPNDSNKDGDELPSENCKEISSKEKYDEEKYDEEKQIKKHKKFKK